MIMIYNTFNTSWYINVCISTCPIAITKSWIISCQNHVHVLVIISHSHALSRCLLFILNLVSRFDLSILMPSIMSSRCNVLVRWQSESKLNLLFISLRIYIFIRNYKNHSTCNARLNLKLNPTSLIELVKQL